jgi:RNA polymerase sigma-70 factor (ECF subfamily)
MVKYWVHPVSGAFLSDEIHWPQLARELGHKLYRYFYASFSAESADDLVQETLLRLHQKSMEEAILAAKGNLITYAFGIAHRVKLEKFKDNRKHPLCQNCENELVDGNHSAEQVLADNQELTMLRLAIASLNRPEQDVLTLVIEKELSLVQIGHILDMPLNTIKSHVHRAKENLKKILSGDKI